MSSTVLPTFHLLAAIKAHTDNINTIAFSDDGTHFASGGDDALLRIAESGTGQATHQYKLVSPIRSIVWNPGYTNVLTAGLRNGIIMTIQIQGHNKCLKFEHSVDGSVHCMAFDTAGKWLAIGNNNEVVVVRQGSISTWSHERKLTAPDSGGSKDITLSVQFHTKEKILLATYLFGGIVAYNTQELDFGMVQWYINVDGLCGASALSPSSRLLAVTDLSNNIHWYDTANEKLVSTIDHGSVTNDNVIIPVTFIGPNMIVVGSAAGEAAIFKSGNQHPLQILLHNGEMVQAIAYCHNKNEDLHILVTGISEQFEECTLSIWIGKGKEQRPKSLFPWKTSISILALGLAALYTATDDKTVAASVKSAVQDIRALGQTPGTKGPGSTATLNADPTPPLMGSPATKAQLVVTEGSSTGLTAAGNADPTLLSKAGTESHVVAEEHRTGDHD
ncbi:WD40-repeat-containing domain protein [Mycena rebaudengoi]|nr:WD40-repeat-containing domain protein [Mycena rebaudengoi]